ncbi:response regulator [Salininema proteolyticum]|uniref:Response regulator n=1 Tax=Salininema proteolyticum TaxID=1607685 RepID=A0ABV8TVV3_9ACTN
MISVVIVDDQPLMRGGFRALVDAEDDMSVVGEASDGNEGVDLIRGASPDVALMDIEMPGATGLQALDALTAEELENTKVIVLSNYSMDKYVYDALRAGAAGYLVKTTEPEALLHAVRSVSAGDMLLSPAVAEKLVGEYLSRPPLKRDGDALTDRETEVVALVARGMGNDAIGRRLYISSATVKTHVHRAMVKLGVKERAGLVIHAYETGLVRPRGA